MLLSPDPYVECFECGHIYQTAADLEAAWVREAPSEEFPRAADITFCQECLHDF